MELGQCRQPPHHVRQIFRRAITEQSLTLLLRQGHRQIKLRHSVDKSRATIDPVAG
jgi:hypothetical protein